MSVCSGTFSINNALYIKCTIIQSFINNYCVCMYIVYVHPQASGGQDKVVHIWDARSNIHLHTFSGHRDIVSVSQCHCVYLCGVCTCMYVSMV